MLDRWWSDRNVWKCFCAIAQWQIVRFENTSIENPPSNVSHVHSDTHIRVHQLGTHKTITKYSHKYFIVCVHVLIVYISLKIEIHTAPNSKNLLTIRQIYLPESRLNTFSPFLVTLLYFHFVNQTSVTKDDQLTK